LVGFIESRLGTLFYFLRAIIAWTVTIACFISGAQRDEEQRLLLLLWDSKSELFTQAVNLHAEQQPVVHFRMINRAQLMLTQS
jgi:hypothetical protein